MLEIAEERVKRAGLTGSIGLVEMGVAELDREEPQHYDAVMGGLCLSDPIYKSGLHQDRLLRIELYAEQCKGADFCEQVCPVNVFRVDPDQRLAFLPRAGQCVQCGACIVQCPFDALHFSSPTGEVVNPATVRRFKLNLLGNRTVVPRSAQTG
jgi:ferredoxin